MNYTFKKIMTASTCLVLFLSNNFYSFSQVAPQAEPVYGGYIEWIDNYPLSTTSTRIFVSTLSPNSMFYSTMLNVNTTTPSFSGWTVVPELDDIANYGHIRCFAVDENSGFVYAATEGGDFIACDHTMGSLYTIGTFPVEAVEAYDSKLFYERNIGGAEYMYVATLDGSGNIVSTTNSLITSSSIWTNQFPLEIHVNTFDFRVYLFVSGSPPIIYRSSDPYYAISSSTTWSPITVSTLAATGDEYVSMGIAPDGRIFAGSYEGNSSSFTAQIAYTNVNGDPWTVVPITDDCGRGEISFGTNSSGDYVAFFSRVYSTDNGNTWSLSGAADGAICGDPINENFAYVRTDWAMGFFNNYTSSVTEINNGLQAVQVNDWTMNLLKDTAWVASKSGIWHVGNYGTLTPNWSNPLWPQWVTVPWTEVEVYLRADPMYCGNSNGDVYKWTSSNGTFTNFSAYDTVFISHFDSPYPNYTWTYGTWTSAIAIDPYSTNERVFVGLYDNEDWNEPEALGAVFVGENIGGIWTFMQILSSPMITAGCDVNDIVVVYESSNCVAYVGVERNTIFGTVNGIYRIEETAPNVFSVSNDLYTGPGYPISATIADLHVSYNDTIFACGTDASGTTVVSYKKAIGDTYWTALATGGLPYPATGRAITYDGSHYDVYIAVDNIIYKLASGSTNWTQYWAYPNGTQIYFIYYDALLVGTSTGLYAHEESTGINENSINEKFVNVSPNPFDNQVELSFTLHDDQFVNIYIYDASGKKVKSLDNKLLMGGIHSYCWYGYTNSGQLATPGLYFYCIETEERKYTGKLIKK